jgi:hypothetical protein
MGPLRPHTSRRGRMPSPTPVSVAAHPARLLSLNGVLRRTRPAPLRVGTAFDARPRNAIEAVRPWMRAEIKMMESRAVGGHVMASARELSRAAPHAAHSAGRAACVAHVAAHELGAAAYAIKGHAAESEREKLAGRLECEWQRGQRPDAISGLVLDDHRLRNDLLVGGARRGQARYPKLGARRS